MNTIRIFQRLFSFILLAIVISGCATQTNLVQQGKLKEEILSKDSIKISSLRIYEMGGKTVITGNIRRKWGYRVPVWGHVDLAWFSPQNELLGQQGTTYLPQRLSMIGASSQFKLEIPVTLEKGSIVKAAFHNSSLKEWPVGNCEKNQAVNKS